MARGPNEPVPRRSFARACVVALVALATVPACRSGDVRKTEAALVTPTLFRPLSHYDDMPQSSFTGAGAYVAVVPEPGTWPAPYGGPARNSRAAEPLLHDHWVVRWEAPLGNASRPRSLLVGAERVLVSGADSQGIWTTAGHAVATFARSPGASFLDAVGKHLLLDDVGGLATYSLDGQREGSILVSSANAGTSREVLQGPGAFAFVTAESPPHGDQTASVQVLRIVDYARVKNHILYGLEPVAGITRDESSVRAAAASAGPVLATKEGVVWCDWRLRALHELKRATNPLALSVDDQGRALLIADDGERRLHIIAPGGPSTDVVLPDAMFASFVPPVVAPSGQIYLTPPGGVRSVSRDGAILWQQTRASDAPGGVAMNGLLLLADDQLYALTPDGRRLPLWRPPAPIVTAAVLAGGLIYVATAETLYALAPAAPAAPAAP